MKDIFAYRLKNARIMAGLSMEALAKSIGISKQMISKYEKGDSVPDSTHLISIAKALHKKTDYFFRPITITLGAIEFRKKASLTISKQESIKENILLKLENYLEIEDSLGINFVFKNPLKHISINNIDDAESAANELRVKWELGHDPIYNIIGLLEYNEIKVIEFDEDAHLFDGLSTFISNKYPVIVVNKNFPIERKRFTLLHELAHLLLDIPKNCTHKDKENICHRFAGALLLPKEIIIKEFGSHRNRFAKQELFSIQKRFGVSPSAIMYRLKNAEIITEQILKGFYISLNKNKDLKIEMETERFLGEENSDRYENLIFRALSQEIISSSKASSMLGISVSQVRNNYSII